jgi:hypothetical protein
MKLTEIKSPKPTPAGLKQAVAEFFELHGEDVPKISSEAFWNVQANGFVKDYFLHAKTTAYRALLTKYLQQLGFGVEEKYSIGTSNMCISMPKKMSQSTQ